MFCLECLQPNTCAFTVFCHLGAVCLLSPTVTCCSVLVGRLLGICMFCLPFLGGWEAVLPLPLGWEEEVQCSAILGCLLIGVHSFPVVGWRPLCIFYSQAISHSLRTLGSLSFSIPPAFTRLVF
jgi:hypothetical protein